MSGEDFLGPPGYCISFPLGGLGRRGRQRCFVEPPWHGDRRFSLAACYLVVRPSPVCCVSRSHPSLTAFVLLLWRVDRRRRRREGTVMMEAQVAQMQTLPLAMTSGKNSLTLTHACA